MFAVIFSDGEIKLDDLKNDCREHLWIPIAVHKDRDGSVTVLCFNEADTAKRFAKRNIPKTWVHGAVLLNDDQIAFINSKKWKIEILGFPRIFRDNPDQVLGFEIVEFSEKPGMKYA